MIINLNNNNWILKGWLKDQWRMVTQMETGVLSVPVMGPVKASVPGAVHADLLKAHLIEDWNVGLNSLKSEWVEHREWTYECEFEVPVELKDERIVLCFDGLDHSGIVKLNDRIVLNFKGMHRRFEADITTDYIKDAKNHLRVIFFQPPEVAGQLGFTSHKMELKSRFNYTWDWCPRIVNIGIWKDVYIKSYSKLRITDFYPKAVVSGGKKFIDLSLVLESLEAGEYTVAYCLSKGGKSVLAGEFIRHLGCAANEKICYTIEDITADLWWPNNLGEHSIYDIEVRILKDGVLCDTATKKIGFREIHFVGNEGALKNTLPYTAVIGGKRVFIKGLNWVPISPLYGTVTRADYQKYISILASMNINMLRVWGGAVLESTDFYDLCDEYGIMVWQEFPQSSSGVDNTPCEEQAFIDELLEVAREHVLQRRHYACHVIWCGGNELMWHNMVPVDDRSRNINSLKNLVLALDGDKHFLPASPSGNTFNFNENEVGNGFNHDVHGPWDYLGDTEHYRISNLDDSLFSSEIGCPAMPRVESLLKYSDNMKLWPPDATNPYYVHRAAWWIRLEQLTSLFGEFAEDGTQIGDYVNASRYIQAESLGYSAQAARRAYPQRSGFIVWMGNEPFPNQSNTSVIEYDGTAKPAFYKLKNAFSAIDVSARYDKIAWQKAEEFQAEIGAVSDSKFGGLDITASIFDVNGNKRSVTYYEKCMVDEVFIAGKIAYVIEEDMKDVFILRVEGIKDEKVVSANDYIFTVGSKKAFSPLLAIEKAVIEVVSTDDGVCVQNKSNIAAIGIFGYVKTETETINLENGYFNLLPNEKIELGMDATVGGSLVLEGMNVEALNYDLNGGTKHDQ